MLPGAVISTAAEEPRESGRLRRSGEIERVCPPKCGYEVFSPRTPCYSPPVHDGVYYKFWVYILSSRSGTLYVGITGFFEQRIHQHKYDSVEGFTKKYRCHRLVYYESYQDVQVAIGPKSRSSGGGGRIRSP